MKLQENNIEVLKRTLRALEAEAQQTRKHLHQLLIDKEQRTCFAEIRLCPSTQTYKVSFCSLSKDLLFSFETKKYSRTLASAGIETANGLRPRISWKDVDAGKVWQAEVVVHDWYWQQHFNKRFASCAKVIDLSRFRKAVEK